MRAFQVRLVFCPVAGALALVLALPYLLASGLEIDNLLVAVALGVVLFLIIAIAAGLIWRRRIIARPLAWALGAPVAVAAAIYLLLRSLSGFEPAEARLALDASLIGALCALFSSGFFLLSTLIAPAAPAR